MEDSIRMEGKKFWYIDFLFFKQWTEFEYFPNHIAQLKSNKGNSKMFLSKKCWSKQSLDILTSRWSGNVLYLLQGPSCKLLYRDHRPFHTENCVWCLWGERAGGWSHTALSHGQVLLWSLGQWLPKCFYTEDTENLNGNLIVFCKFKIENGFKSYHQS